MTSYLKYLFVLQYVVIDPYVMYHACLHSIVT